jgi:hypothetical protein
MSLFRRAGSAIARIFQSAADPATEPDRVMLYAKDAAGVAQLFARSDDGTVHQITPGGGGGEAVIFDDSVPAAEVNIRSDRASNQSPIDNTQAQITNLGSADGAVYPAAAAVGATGIGATIGGGDDNAAVGMYSTVAGGAGNWTDGVGAAIPGGQYNYVAGDYATAEGFASDAEAPSSHAEGDGSFVDLGATGAHAEGSSSIGTSSLRAHAESSGVVGDDCPDCHAEGNGLINNTATYSHAEGHNTTIGAGVEAGHAEGFNCDVLESYGHAEGESCIVAVGAFGAHAEGASSLASGLAAHAEGDSTIASGAQSHAEGSDTNATGIAAHAEGRLSTTASGDSSHAQGDFCFATARASHAQGMGARAIRVSQAALASDTFQNFTPEEGAIQTSLLVFRAQTPGLAISESDELEYGPDGTTILGLVLENDKAYSIRVTATIGGRQAGPVQRSRTIVLNLNARRVAGTSVIAASGVGDAYGDASTATWTLVASVGAAPDRIVFTFSTGAGAASKCYVAARVEFTEAQFVPV